MPFTFFETESFGCAPSPVSTVRQPSEKRNGLSSISVEAVGQPLSKYEERRANVLRLTSASVSSTRKFLRFYGRLLCSVMSCPLRIRLRASQENDDILPKFPAAVLSELLGRHARGQIKDPQIGRLAHASHGVFRPKSYYRPPLMPRPV